MAKMPAPIVPDVGVKISYTLPEQVLKIGHAYIDECENTPVKTIDPKQANLTRCPSRLGLYRALGVSDRTVQYWLDPTHRAYRPEMVDAVDTLIQRIDERTFELAAARVIPEGMGIRILGLAEKREQKLTADVRGSTGPQIDACDIPDRVHPDATIEQLQELADRGQQPLLFSERQIAAGIPYVHPSS